MFIPISDINSSGDASVGAAPPLVSIVTVVRNGAGTIRDTLESVRSQRNVRVEHIVVDGASTDGTAELIKGFGSEQVQLISEPDTGIYDAMNKGISIARGEWLLFLGSDDILADSSVLADVLLTQQTDEYVLVCGVSRDLSGRRFLPHLNLRTTISNTIHHQAALYRRCLFEAFRYRTDIPVVSDYELNFRLYIERSPVLFLTREIAIVGDRGVSRTASRIVSQVHLYKIRNQYISKFVNAFYLSVGLLAIFPVTIRRGVARLKQWL